MEKQNIYTNGQIYSIRSHQTKDIYIGSSIQPLHKRLHSHKRDYNWFLKDKGHYVSSFEIIMFDDCYIELVENFPCMNKKELNKREGQHIRNTDCINRYVAGRTKQEYLKENKEQVSERHKKYYENNKNRISEYYKKWREEHQEEIINKKKIYNDANREKISAYNKLYREKMKDAKN